MYSAGVSSGAAFAVRLPNKMPGELSGIISEVLAVEVDGTEYDVSSWGERSCGCNLRWSMCVLRSKCWLAVPHHPSRT